MKRLIFLLLIIPFIGFGQTTEKREYFSNGQFSRGVVVTDTFGNVAVDSPTGALMIVDYDHHEIHTGSHYFLDNGVTLGSGDSATFVLVTPDSTRWAHMLFNVASSAQANFYVIEGITSYTGGDTISAYNNNRNSSKTSMLTIVKNIATVTIGSPDTLAIHYLGSGTNPSTARAGDGERGKEIILKSDTKYYFVIDSGAASNRIDWSANWYEHINKSE